MSNSLVAADLFAGAGGLSEGFRSAGFEIAFANDVDADCRETYERNHPGTPFLGGSIEDLAARQIFSRTGLSKGEIDVLIGGPPCQGFSINAPARSGRDRRNFLFEHYGRLVLEGLRPKVILMENVPGMLSLDGGRFVGEIYSLFEKAGYRMSHMVLCAAHYGVPQERWRLFFIGTRLPHGEISFPFPTHWAPVRTNFTGGRRLTWMPQLKPMPLLAVESLKRFTSSRQAIGDLPPLGAAEGCEEMPYGRSAENSYQRQLRNGSRRLYNHVAGRLSAQNLARLKHIPPGGSWRDIPHDLLPKGMKRARRSDHTRRYGRLDPHGLSGTILTKCDPHWGSFFHYSQDRALTAREAARLQSFPDSFRFYGSRVSQFKQVGNAVPPILAQTVAEHLKETLLAERPLDVGKEPLESLYGTENRRILRVQP